MKRAGLLLAAAAFLAVLAAPAPASADVNNFTVTDFRADETLSRADPQGELRIIEHIDVYFNDFNHGILRAIPGSYGNHSLQLRVNGVTSGSGAPAAYTTYGSNGNTVLKIGDPDRTLTGSQEYTIDYTLRNVITFYNDHDELYWDINGDQWQQPFNHVSATLHLPAGLRQDRQPVCYAGRYGGVVHNCAVSTRADTITTSTEAPLAAYQTLTLAAGFKPGYFQASKWYETLGERAAPLIRFFAPVLLIGGGGLVYWLVRGRDPKGRGVIIPQYDAPDGLKPIQVGAIVDFGVDNRDITATIIDLAVRKYLKIIETKKNQTLRKDVLTYSLQLANPDFSGLDAYETILMNGLFSDKTAGAVADVSALKTKLYSTAQSLSAKVEGDLASQGYFRGNPLKSGKALGTGVVVLIVALFYFGHALGSSVMFGSILGAGIAYLFANKAAARTAKGVAAKEHAEGLKLYLEVAEKDRLEKLQGPDAAYAQAGQEPRRTVELFEKLLPYAMVLGVERQWAEQFKDLYSSPPDWYSGNWTAFNAGYMVGALNSGIGSAVNGAFSAPSSSGGSGFGGGGGFSGGGGGGGGGGGW